MSADYGVDPRAGAAGLRKGTTKTLDDPPRIRSDRSVGIAPPPPASRRPLPPSEDATGREPVVADSGGDVIPQSPQSDPLLNEARVHATTVYLAARLSEALRMERARTKRAQVDIILDAVSAHFSDVAARAGRLPGTEFDPVLGITRRSRRRVEDGRVVQLRFSTTEKAALARLAARADLTVSALVSESLSAQLDVESSG